MSPWLLTVMPMKRGEVDGSTLVRHWLTPLLAVLLCGAAASASGDHQRAVRELKGALGIHPRFPLALNELGAQHMRLGQLGDAADAFAAAVKLAPDEPVLRVNYGILLIRRKKYAEAEAQRARARSRSTSRARRRLARRRRARSVPPPRPRRPRRRAGPRRPRRAQAVEEMTRGLLSSP